MNQVHRRSAAFAEVARSGGVESCDEAAAGKLRGRDSASSAARSAAASAGAGAEHGRGATFNPGNRFRRETREAVDDGWAAPARETQDADESPPRSRRP